MGASRRREPSRSIKILHRDGGGDLRRDQGGLAACRGEVFACIPCLSEQRGHVRALTAVIEGNLSGGLPGKAHVPTLDRGNKMNDCNSFNVGVYGALRFAHGGLVLREVVVRDGSVLGGGEDGLGRARVFPLPSGAGSFDVAQYGRSGKVRPEWHDIGRMGPSAPRHRPSLRSSGRHAARRFATQILRRSRHWRKPDRVIRRRRG